MRDVFRDQIIRTVLFIIAILIFYYRDDIINLILPRAADMFSIVAENIRSILPEIRV